MPRVVNIKANGHIGVLFGPGQPSLNFGVGDPLIPSATAASLDAALAAMQTAGVSEIHMEQDTFRVFTHTVQGGLVTHEDGINNPIFSTIMDAQAALVSALSPEQAP